MSIIQLLLLYIGKIKQRPWVRRTDSKIQRWSLHFLYHLLIVAQSDFCTLMRGRAIYSVWCQDGTISITRNAFNRGLEAYLLGSSRWTKYMMNIRISDGDVFRWVTSDKSFNQRRGVCAKYNAKRKRSGFSNLNKDKRGWEQSDQHQIRNQ